MNPTGVRQLPVLLVVDDNLAALSTMSRELSAHNGGHYRVVSEGSAAAAEQTLRTLCEAGEEVALVLADHTLAGTTGGELLARARQLHPLAKRALVVPRGAWRDRVTASQVLGAVARGQAEAYLLKP